MKITAFLVLSLSTFLFACSNESNPNNSMQTITLQDIQKEWQLVSINNNKTELVSSLKIDNQAQATGNFACNNFFGAVELQDNKLRIYKMGSTRKMCAPEVNNLEMTIRSTLSIWSEIQVIKQTLTITGEQHTLVYAIK